MPQNLSASSSDGNLALRSQEFIPFTAKNSDTLQLRVVCDHNANSVCLECNICGKLIERGCIWVYEKAQKFEGVQDNER